MAFRKVHTERQDLIRQRVAKRRVRRIADGKCPSCLDGELRDGFSACAACRKKQRDHKRSIYKGGECPRDGSPTVPGESECYVCRDQRRAQELCDRNEAIRRYGGYCQCCGEKGDRFLCIDHTKNDGAAHRKELGVRKLYAWLRLHNYPDGFQTLCYNCNVAKHLNGGTCPHLDNV